MNVSPKAIAMIKHHEGVRYRPYQCPAKLWTVGVGHVIDPNHGKLTIEQRQSLRIPDGWDRKLTEDEVNELLKFDLNRFELGVEKFCPVPFTQGMFDGLVSFAFNVGLGTLQRSTLRQKLLRGDKEGAAEELMKYCMAGGKVLKGLQNRRIDERALFISG
jgi:lysozyme